MQMLYVCVCLSDLSLTVVWVIPGKLNIPVHAQEFASDHECCQPHMVARYLPMYVCVCRHVLVHTNFCFHFFFTSLPPLATFQDLTRPQLSGLLPYALKWKVSASLFFYFFVFSGQAENVFASSSSSLLMSFLYRIDAINGRASEGTSWGKSWGAHKKSALNV